MKRSALCFLLAATSVFTAFADQPVATANKAEVIKAIGQAIDGRFIQENLSIDKKSVRWEFLDGACHGLPGVVDLIAYSTIEQAKAASVAAFSQAEHDFLWIMDKSHKLTGVEPTAETTEQYLENICESVHWDNNDWLWPSTSATIKSAIAADLVV